MASNRIKGITIEIDGNTSKLVDSLKDVNKQIKDTQAELKDVEKLLKMDPGNVELLQQKHELLGKAVNETKEKLKQLKDAQAQMKASGIDETSEQYRGLQREIVDCENALKGLTKEAGESTTALQKVASAGEGLKNAGDGIKAAGREISKGSAVVAAGMTVAVKKTMDFDEQMSKVRAISGATEEDFQRLRDKAREMGATTKFSATESAEALEYMAMAGWKTDDMISGLDGILNLAAASGEELGTTSDIVTDALTAFGLTAKDSSHFADVLAVASSNANTNVAMMGETFKYAGPLFGSMGYSIEDAAIATGLMANSGIKASQAGTALRSIISRMAKPTEEVENAMEALNISLDDGHGNMYSFYEVMQQMRGGFGELKISEEELNSSLAELDEQLESGTINQKEYDKAVEDLMTRAYGAEAAMKAEAATMLAGKNSLSGLLAIVNASDEDFQKLTDAVYNADGAAQEMSDIMQDNLAGQITILKSQLEELAISFGDIMMPYLKKFVEWLQKLIDGFNNLSPTTKEIITIIGAIIVVLGPLLLIVGSFVSTIGQMMIFLPMISSACAPVVAAIGSLTAAFGPVIAVIGAVGAAVYVLIKHWDDIKAAAEKLGNFLGEKWNWIKEKTSELASSMKEKWSSIKESIGEKWDGLKSKASDVWGGIKNKFHDGWSNIKSLFSQKLEFPKIKLPHFNISGKLSLMPPSVPKLKIDWYKKAYDDAYLLNSPTIFGAAGGSLLGGGEGNGSEAVVGTDKLMSMMADVVGNQSTNITVVLDGDAQGVFKLVRTENTKFTKSNGYNPLMI